ncbi:unnamed protein product [Oppiella nova]|uniref:Integrator complex subunit 14 C-terminal domain-containing protein n=1 Tax=Oppiella nova TaxID=334625 RepID=A0A7R9MIA7_9ACAR|nr:unnamed protein product [Oppiella nova]CAG2177615.1 unnamed protein product [Oppiella nova]
MFKCGSDAIAWIPNLKNLGFSSLSIPQTVSEINEMSSKKNFSQGCVVWLKQSFLQSDIQKILRHARKLPEKTANFYKELNRFRRAALSFGFYSLIEGLASILERECRMLPGSAHPEAALQLTHAVNALRLPTDAHSYNHLRCVTLCPNGPQLETIANQEMTVRTTIAVQSDLFDIVYLNANGWVG